MRSAAYCGLIFFKQKTGHEIATTVSAVLVNRSSDVFNDLVSLQKDSGLIAVLGVVDAIRSAQIATATDFNFTPYVVAGLLFVALTIPLTRATDWIARRQGWYGVAGTTT